MAIFLRIPRLCQRIGKSLGRCYSPWFSLVQSLRLALVISSMVSASKAQTTPDLSDISLDTLANTEITSVSRKEEKLSEAAAAVFVITSEDIRRSGLTSIPELLRMVPGITVAQIDANNWAITARGFNEVLADKLLVLIDGRTVYDPLSSGVYWDVQDTVIEDIDRIEVIRGPGATLWGANAVNGVVNIITRKAKDTQGTLVTAIGGDQEGEVAAIRYGGAIGDRGYYRIFTKYSNQDAYDQASGQEASDSWHLFHTGFRTDWNLSTGNDLTVQGDVYNGNGGQSVPGLLSLSPPTLGDADSRTFMSGGNLLGRWHHESSTHLDTTFQMYFERANRHEPLVLNEDRHTIDLDFEQQYKAGERQSLTWGGDYRFAGDHTVGTLNLSFNPAARSTNLYGAFLQDEIVLVPDRLRITLGSKLEHNYYSGFALQPNARMFWDVRSHYGVWMAISRASESSSRFDADIRSNNNAYVNENGTTVLESSFGTPHLPPESVTAYELGQRATVTKWLTLDVSAFYNHYSDRHTQEPAPSFFEADPPPLHLEVPTITASHISGETHGIGAFSQLKPANFWTLFVAYTFFEIHLHAPGSQDTDTAPTSEGSTPRHAYQLRSEINLPHKLQFDSAAYYVGALHDPEIPSYTRVDARLGWQASEHVEISLVGQNLLSPHHFEFGSGGLVNATEISRTAYGKFTWRF